MSKHIQNDLELSKLELENGLTKHQLGELVDYTRLIGGRNNKIFKLQTSTGTYFLKKYFYHPLDKRERLNSEWIFASLLYGHGFRSVARPIARIDEARIGIYEYIEAQRCPQKQITLEVLDTCADFYCAINSHCLSYLDKNIPIASEACFSIKEHLLLVERRLELLATVKIRDELSASLHKFLEQSLFPIAVNVRRLITSKASALNIAIESELTPSQRVLSPSDFGPHNMLFKPDTQTYYFADFEYAGIDDPAKMLADFFSQLSFSVDMKYFDSFAYKSLNFSDSSKLHIQRAKLLLPLYRIKSACIMLNNFLEIGIKRRSFAKENDCSNAVKANQLDKAKNHICRLEKFLQELI